MHEHLQLQSQQVEYNFIFFFGQQNSLKFCKSVYHIFILIDGLNVCDCY